MTATEPTTGAPDAPAWEVLAVRYGTLATRKSALFYRYESHGEPDAPQEMDYFFWIVRGGDRTVVVDTGFEPSCGQRRGRTCVTTPQEALARLGIDPGSVEHLILTHFHYDHIGNVGLFPTAELIVPAAEYEFFTSPISQRFHFQEPVEGPEIDAIVAAAEAGRVRLVDDQLEVAPGVTAIVVGGHSPGQIIVDVQAGNRPVVLASDAVHLYEELEKDRPFSVLVDLADMYRAFDLLREREAQGAVVVAGHDPEVTSRFPAVERDGVTVAYRLS